MEKIITFQNELSDEDHPKLEEIKQACQTIHLVLSPSKQKNNKQTNKRKSVKTLKQIQKKKKKKKRE